jgi:SET domain-containing protein
MCFYAIKEIKEGAKLTFDYNWECDEDQTMTSKNATTNAIVDVCIVDDS